MQIWEITPVGGGWRVALQDEADGQRFDDLALAETRARWLAVRHEVKGWPAEIRVLAADGGLVGVWRGERYTTARSVVFSQAA